MRRRLMERNNPMKLMFYALRPFDELAYAQRFSREYGIDFAWTPDFPDDDNLALAAGCEAVCTTPCNMGGDLLDRFAALGVRYLPCRSVGYDHIDLARAKQLGMRVSNVGYPPNGVANYAIMLMLMASRRVGHILKRAEVQDYSLKGKMGRDITGATVGVIGTGRIGCTVLEHLSGFGCRLLAYSENENEAAKRYAEYVDFDTLLRQSDIITLHANATPRNRHMIDAAAIARMKDGAVLINTARGSLIDSDAMIDALESGKLGAAGLDVIENETDLYYLNRSGEVLQNRELAILRSMPNVVLTPHTAFYTDTNVASMVQGAFEAARCFAAGEPCPTEIIL